MVFLLNMKIDSQNNYYNSFCFKSYYKPLVRKVNSGYLHRADYLIPIIKDANSTLAKLEKAKNPLAKNLFEFLKKELRVLKFNQEEKSIVFSNGKSNFIVSTDGKNSITFQEQSKETGAIEKTLETANIKVVNQSDSIKRVELAEDFMKKVLDCIDFALLKYRKIVSKTENSELIKNVDITPVLSTSENDFVSSENIKQGVLTPELISALNEIEKVYTTIFADLQSLSNPGTRSHLKNAYYNIIKSPRGSRIIGFKKDGYNMFVNYTNDHTKKYLILQKITEDGICQNLILNKEGKAYKQKALPCLKENSATVEFYTQSEIESDEFKNLVFDAKKELIGYSEFIKEKLDMKDDRDARLSTSQIGTFTPEVLGLCEEAKDKFNLCKTALATIHDKNKKEKAKDVFGIIARAGSPSFILKNVTKEKDDLQISFPIVNGIQCTKILVLEGVDSIKNSFFIMEDKLVKFEAKKLGRSIRIDNKLNYYSQEELDSFGIDTHLRTIIQKLESITEGIYSKNF